MTTLHEAAEQMLGWGMPPFPPGHPRISGRFERYGPKKRAFYKLTEIRSRAGTYVVAGVFGVFGQLDTQRVEIDWKGIAAEERAEMERRHREAEEREREKRAERAHLAANRANQQWKAGVAVAESAYLTRKGVPLPATGLRGLKLFKDGTVLVPVLRYPEGLKAKPVIVGLQKIAPDGSKKFNTGMEKAGGFCRLGPAPKGTAAVLVAEGLATALSIGMALEWSHTVVVAFDAYNLEPVGRELRKLYPASPLLFCADDDFLTEGNPGLSRATRARDACMPAAAIAPRFASRPEGEGAPKWTDFNDLHAAEGLAVVREQLGDALRFMAKPAEPISTGTAAAATGGSGGAGGDDGRPQWAKGLLLTSEGGYKGCWQNVAYALERNPKLQGLVGVDEFATCLVALRPPPWALNGEGDPSKYPREWTDADDSKLGMWMSFSQFPRLVLSGLDGYRAGVNAAALTRKTHPLRQWLKGLEWDGKPRLDGWITRVCSPRMEFSTSTEYMRLVGRWFLIGAVMRVLRPGCKLDHAPIFEGAQGQGKSTLLSVLAGDYFADTPFVMGDTNSFLALKGKWIYEIAELDSFNRSEQTRAKAFMSSAKDTYRAPYERRTADHPRQCVFAGSTNAHEYFKDSTGNRRYWPVRVEGVDLESLREIRDQLFAEAMVAALAGERYWPTAQEQREIFGPEQESREIADARKQVLAYWLDGLDRHGEPLMAAEKRDRVTVADVLFDHWKVEYAKVDNAKGLETKAGALLNELGWKQVRESGGARRRFYVRPDEPVAASEQRRAPAVAGEEGDALPL